MRGGKISPEKLTKSLHIERGKNHENSNLLVRFHVDQLDQTPRYLQ